MNLLDFYYRGFKEYRKETENNKTCIRDRNIYIKNGLEFDHFVVTKYLCTIESDWIEAIEKGLEFVEKAVKEERQFIRVDGEVVPIEKAKKVSKYSVEHLARHSNMITHVPEKEGDPIIPDGIYMIEKLSDYAVYENRFLYMLLCYIRDFIALRMERIQKLRMTYICEFELKKEQNGKKRLLSFETKFNETRYDNPYPIKDDLSQSLLQRIEDCQQIVIMLLNTNLMTEVAKSPMIKPPIIKTNVLKMNNNFKNSLALYDYIVSYNKDGYTAEPVIKNFAPFSNLLADELAELGALTAFLSYKHGNELADILQMAYLEEENRRKIDEAAKLNDQIKKLKKRVAESGMGMEEYVLLVEKRNRMLEDDSKQLIIAKNEIKLLNEKIEELKQEIKELNRKIEALNDEIQEKIKEIAYLNQKYIDDMAALKKQHEIEIATLNAEHEAAIEQLKKEHEEDINQINLAHEEEIEQLKKDYEQDLIMLEERLALEHQAEINKYLERIDELNAQIEEASNRYNEMVLSYEERISELNNKIKEARIERDNLIKDYENKLKEMKMSYEGQIDQNTIAANTVVSGLNDRIENLVNEKTFLSAEYNALRYKNGLLAPSSDYTSKERFDELEQEFLAFNDFFKAQWALTKKQIRKEIFWTKEEKKQKKHKQKPEKKVEDKAIDDNAVVEDETKNYNEEALEDNLEVSDEALVLEASNIEDAIEASEVNDDIIEESESFDIEEVQEEVVVNDPNEEIEAITEEIEDANEELKVE